MIEDDLQKRWNECWVGISESDEGALAEFRQLFDDLSSRDLNQIIYDQYVNQHLQNEESPQTLGGYCRKLWAEEWKDRSLGGLGVSSECRGEVWESWRESWKELSNQSPRSKQIAAEVSKKNFEIQAPPSNEPTFWEKIWKFFRGILRLFGKRRVLVSAESGKMGEHQHLLLSDSVLVSQDHVALLKESSFDALVEEVENRFRRVWRDNHERQGYIEGNKGFWSEGDIEIAAMQKRLDAALAAETASKKQSWWRRIFAQPREEREEVELDLANVPTHSAIKAIMTEWFLKCYRERRKLDAANEKFKSLLESEQKESKDLRSQIDSVPRNSSYDGTQYKGKIEQERFSMEVAARVELEADILRLNQKSNDLLRSS